MGTSKTVKCQSFLRGAIEEMTLCNYYCDEPATVFWAARMRNESEVKYTGCWCNIHAISLEELNTEKSVFEEITEEEYKTHELFRL